MEGGWEVSTWEVFLPGWKFFFQAGTFSSRWEVFLPAGYFSFRLGVISFIPKFQWFRDFLMVLCCDMRSLCLPSIPPASYRLCGCLAIGDSYEKSMNKNKQDRMRTTRCTPLLANAVHCSTFECLNIQILNLKYPMIFETPGYLQCEKACLSLRHPRNSEFLRRL